MVNSKKTNAHTQMHGHQHQINHQALYLPNGFIPTQNKSAQTVKPILRYSNLKNQAI